MLKLFEENIKNGMCENLENKLRFDNLPELQKEILRATDSFIYDDFKLSSGNYFNQNFLFDPLNGNFREVVYDTTTEPKEVSLGNNLDFPLKTKNTFRKNKLIDNRNPNELEGNSQFMQEQEIIEKAGAWETLIENFTSKHEIQMKEKRENDLLLELFSFKEFDLSTEKSQTKSLVHDDNHEFWKVFEKKV